MHRESQSMYRQRRLFTTMRSESKAWTLDTLSFRIFIHSRSWSSSSSSSASSSASSSSIIIINHHHHHHNHHHHHHHHHHPIPIITIIIIIIINHKSSSKISKIQKFPTSVSAPTQNTGWKTNPLSISVILGVWNDWKLFPVIMSKTAASEISHDVTSFPRNHAKALQTGLLPFPIIMEVQNGSLQ